MYVMDNYIKRIKQVFDKRRLVPVNFKEKALCPKYVLYDPLSSRGKGMPNHKRRLVPVNSKKVALCSNIYHLI